MNRAPTTASSCERSASGEMRSFSRNCRRNSFVSRHVRRAQAGGVHVTRPSPTASARSLRQLFRILADDELARTRPRANSATAGSAAARSSRSATTSPFVEHDHPVAHALDHLEDVRAVENGLAARRQHAHEVPQHQRRGHVEPGLGFVEQHHRRIVQQRRGDHDLLPHALRVRGDAPDRRRRSGRTGPGSRRSSPSAARPASRAAGRPAGGIRGRRETDRGTALPECSQARGETRRGRRGCRGRRTRTSPDEGSSRPASIRAVVVLPEPFGPR